MKLINRKLFTASLLLAVVNVAQAQDEVIKGTYMASKDLCERAKKEGAGTVAQEGNIVLDNGGLETVEYNCAFLQFLKNPNMPAAWTVVSMCEEPDHAEAELFAVVERREGELDISSLSETTRNEAAAARSPETEGGAADNSEAGNTEEEGGGGISGTYHRCEGIEP